MGLISRVSSRTYRFDQSCKEPEIFQKKNMSSAPEKEPYIITNALGERQLNMQSIIQEFIKGITNEPNKPHGVSPAAIRRMLYKSQYQRAYVRSPQPLEPHDQGFVDYSSDFMTDVSRDNFNNFRREQEQQPQVHQARSTYSAVVRQSLGSDQVARERNERGKAPVWIDVMSEHKKK